MSRMTAQQIEQFMDQQFPQARGLGCTIESVGEGKACLRLAAEHRHLRPGDTVSGPTLMTLADTAMFFAILGELGPVALAVTTNLNINFLRRVGTGDLLAEAELLKLGKRLAVGAVHIKRADDNALVAHATLTYSLPPAA